MKKFAIRVVVFILPLLISAVLIELWARNNIFKAKSTYIEQHLSDIQVIALGSSQTQSAINPQYLDLKLASLAHSGSTLNLETLLFDKFFPRLPQLEFVIFELAPYNLERWTNEKSLKNHLYWIYYDLNNYGKSPPLRENFLLTANPQVHLNKLINLKFKSPLNEFGFVTQAPFTLADTNKQKEIINQQQVSERQLQALKPDRKKLYRKNAALLDARIQRCLDNKVKVILLSTPLFHSYKQRTYQLGPDKCKRRDAYLKKWAQTEGVYIWNWEDLFPGKKENFVNENHLSPQGAQELTVKMNQKLSDL